jgi:hypothetical protein
MYGCGHLSGTEVQGPPRSSIPEKPNAADFESAGTGSQVKRKETSWIVPLPSLLNERSFSQRCRKWFADDSAFKRWFPRVLTKLGHFSGAKNSSKWLKMGKNRIPSKLLSPLLSTYDAASFREKRLF